jgi:hypothetical protein
LSQKVLAMHRGSVSKEYSDNSTPKESDELPEV